MRRISPKLHCFLAVLAAVLVATPAGAQQAGYPAGGYYGGSVVPAGGAHMRPPLPASPLAGGMPAAQGSAFVDAHGQSVVVPASYCPPAYGGGGIAATGAGYGDPMQVDFGGYPREQCGPHYFDVSFGVVFLQAEEVFEGLAPFSATGALIDPNNPTFFIDPANDFGEFEPGWEVAVRYDIGPLSVVEATYMGLYEIGFEDERREANPILNSVFSDYGVPAPTIPGIDQAEFHRLEFFADLQSTELSYRRYWVGNRASISGTWLIGARYWRYTDELRFIGQDADLVVANPDPNVGGNVTATNGVLNWNSENDLVGFQFGGDAWMCLRQGLRIGCEGLAGVYNNRYHFRANGNFDFVGTDPGNAEIFNTVADGDQVAFAGEMDISMVADILPSWSLRGGYRVMYLSSLVTAANNVRQSDLDAPVVWTQESLLFHGFHGGMEYIW